MDMRNPPCFSGGLLLSADTGMGSFFQRSPEQQTSRAAAPDQPQPKIFSTNYATNFFRPQLGCIFARDARHFLGLNASMKLNFARARPLPQLLENLL